MSAAAHVDVITGAERIASVGVRDTFERQRDPREHGYPYVAAEVIHEPLEILRPRPHSPLFRCSRRNRGAVLAPAAAAAKAVVLPWIAQTRGPLVASTDLYVHNPGSAPLVVTLGLVVPERREPGPQAVVRTLEPGATWFVSDAPRQLFGAGAERGFLVATTERGAVDPLVVDFTVEVVVKSGTLLSAAVVLDGTGGASTVVLSETR